MADQHELSDEDGRLYGLWPDAPGELRDIGTWGQQVAEFPVAEESGAWHGYPLFPLDDRAPPNRRGQKHQPERRVLDKMVSAALITLTQRTRLLKGRHA